MASFCELVASKGTRTSQEEDGGQTRGRSSNNMSRRHDPCTRNNRGDRAVNSGGGRTTGEPQTPAVSLTPAHLGLIKPQLSEPKNDSPCLEAAVYDTTAY